MANNEKVRRPHFGLNSAKTREEMWDLIRGLFEGFETYGVERFEEWQRRGLERNGEDGCQD